MPEKYTGSIYHRGETIHEEELRTHSIVEGSLLPQSVRLSVIPSFPIEIDLSKRISVDHPEKTIEYQGQWYCQADQPTGIAWAIANAGLVIGQKPDMDCIKYLSETAKSEPGLSITLFRRANEHVGMPYGFKRFYGGREDFIDTAVEGLDSGRAIMVANSDHVVCLGGYRIDKNGFLDFQVVDSAGGVMFIPQEPIVATHDIYWKYITQVKGTPHTNPQK
ncbi:MAG: hypothetical protein Q7S61_05025 [bacterium]|nr:hypothetical protein [bacterium]